MTKILFANEVNNQNLASHDTNFKLLVAILTILAFLVALILTIFLTSSKSKMFFKSLIVKLTKNNHLNYMELNNFSQKLSGVLLRLSHDVVGGLIVIEKKDNLDDYIKLGYSVKASFSSEFAFNIFYNKSSPLHDGGMIIRNYDIISVSSYFPMTKKNLSTTYGARHRAAVGVTEESDALAFVVSETSGRISYSYKGKIFYLDQDAEKLSSQVYDLLNKGYLSNKTEEIIINDSIE